MAIGNLVNQSCQTITKTLLVTVIGCLFGSASAGQTKKGTCDQVTPLLATLSSEGGSEERALSKLFEIGDECIDDVIFTLDRNSDVKLRLAAQRILRYLANEKGLRALAAWNNRNTSPYAVRGPVPVPIMEFDYEMIETNLIGDGQPDLGLVTTAYLYALAIDKQSPKSRLLLEKALKRLESFDPQSISRRVVQRLKANYPLQPFSIDGRNLERAVIENAFFLNERDKEFASARVLSCNSTKDKALVVLHISRGPLAEEWHHIVLRKLGSTWEFFSITFVKQS